MQMAKGERIQHYFTFMEKEQKKRSISSIDWSPKVKLLINGPRSQSWSSLLIANAQSGG